VRDERGRIATPRPELGDVAVSAAVVSLRARSFVAARYSTSEVLSTPAQLPPPLDTASRETTRTPTGMRHHDPMTMVPAEFLD
jgi:hypothetical protein